MNVTEIEAAITELPTSEIEALMNWLTEHYHSLWDRQIEEDLRTGRLDSFLAEVDGEIEAGLVRPL